MALRCYSNNINVNKSSKYVSPKIGNQVYTVYKVAR